MPPPPSRIGLRTFASLTTKIGGSYVRVFTVLHCLQSINSESTEQDREKKIKKKIKSSGKLSCTLVPLLLSNLESSTEKHISSVEFVLVTNTGFLLGIFKEEGGGGGIPFLFQFLFLHKIICCFRLNLKRDVRV